MNKPQIRERIEGMNAELAGSAATDWKLVPVEPTGVMKDCGASAIPVLASTAWDAAWVYRAMLAAAPVPPVARAEKETCRSCEGADAAYGEGCTDCNGKGFNWEPIEIAAPVPADLTDEQKAASELLAALVTCQKVLRAVKIESGLYFPHADDAISSAIAKARSQQ